jgi:hypothetical protein
MVAAPTVPALRATLSSSLTLSAFAARAALC